MSSVPEIEDLKSIIEPHLDGGRVISYSSRYLTKPGDNYGSIMLSITAKIQRPNGDVEELPLVAKLPPLTNDLYWQIFQPERTCISENTMYTDVSPSIRQLQLEAGIPESQLFDGFPRSYGCRISLNPNATVVDRDAVLMQENLQTSGFKAGKRHTMFDFTHTKLILEYMAQYHALPIALRKLKPELFDKRIRPYFGRFNMNATMHPSVIKKMREETLQELLVATNNNEKLVNEVSKRFDANDEWMAQTNTKDTPYTTLAHCDLWINNMMVKYDEDGKPYKLKFVDFQIVQYESLAHDVIFFLFTSVDTEVLEQHYEKLLRIYYDAFVRCLKKMHVPTTEYTYEGFLEEVRRVAHIELPHAIFMMKVILADNSTMPDDFKDLDIELLSKNGAISEVLKKTGDMLSLAQKFKYI